MRDQAKIIQRDSENHDPNKAQPVYEPGAARTIPAPELHVVDGRFKKALL
ncbi:hypothetical protein EV291_10716 [Rhizobium sp. BK068]|nr:hypothetical protein EV291_10716 [Rhizobium sp. BK068]